MNFVTVSFFLLSFTVGFVFSELNAFEESDTLFLLTFQTPIQTFQEGDVIYPGGINAVPGTYSHPLGETSNVVHDDHATNPFCFAGLPLINGGSFNFRPTKSEWGQTGNFTLEIWAGARTGTGYTYYEALVFGFPKHGSSKTSITAYSKAANIQQVTANFTVSSTAEVLEYSAISYNGTYLNIYQNGVLSLAQPLLRGLTTDIASPLVTIGGKTMSGLTSTYYTGTMYMVRYSGTAKSPEYIVANYKTYLDESQQTMTFKNQTQAECSKLCMDGVYGFGGRKKCRSSTYAPGDKTCTLKTFVCDWSGVVPSAV